MLFVKHKWFLHLCLTVLVVGFTDGSGLGRGLVTKSERLYNVVSRKNSEYSRSVLPNATFTRTKALRKPTVKTLSKETSYMIAAVKERLLDLC